MIALWRRLLGVGTYADRWLSEEFMSEKWVQKAWIRDARGWR